MFVMFHFGNILGCILTNHRLAKIFDETSKAIGCVRWRTKTIEDICIKIDYISERKIIVLFRSSNMAVVHTLYSFRFSTLTITSYLHANPWAFALKW